MATDPGSTGSSGEDDLTDRRSGADRRSGGERRQGGRRHRRQGVNEERRKGDRRKATRRTARDRRRKQDPRFKKRRRTSAGSDYSEADVATVRRLLTQVGGRVTCPACDGPFALGPADRRGRDVTRPVWCADCGRGTVVVNCLLSRVMMLSGIKSLRATVQTILAGAGHEVVEPPDVRAALDVYRENPADVVLMDAFALDQMDGRGFIRRLRVEFSDARVVILAPRPSYRIADPLAAAEGLGATGVIRIPFTRDDLLRTVRDARG